MAERPPAPRDLSRRSGLRREPGPGEPLEQAPTAELDFTVLNAILQTAEAGSAYFDRDHRLRFWTLSYGRLFPEPKALVLGSAYDTLMAAADLQAAAGREPASLMRAFEAELADGRTLGIREHPVPSGGTVQWLSDRSERRALKGELELLRARLAEADRAKGKFFATASHDLRQPLHAAALFQQLLASRVTDPGLAGLIGKLGEALRSVEFMLSQVVEASRLDAGLLQPVRQNFPLHELLQHLVESCRTEAAACGVTLRLSACSAVVTSDPLLLESALKQLLVNALRRSGASRVLVGCRRRAAALEIQVLDNGLGIARALRTRIFEDFETGPGALRGASGLGLGLGIVRRLSALLGHPVTFASVPGRGSSFGLLLQH